MKIEKKIISILLAFLLAFSYSQAQENEDKTESPYFEVISDDVQPLSFPLKSTSADVKIAGIIADVTVTQEYENSGTKPIEAIYVFPASTRAAVYAMKMTIGERIIQAKIQEKQKAREQYEQAKQQGQSASLLEQKRPNVFQMNVANIMPGDVIKVELKYTESLIPEEGLYEFVYPTVVGPRFANGSEGPATPASDGWVQNPYTSEGVDPLYDFDISVEVNAGMPLSDLRCKTHDVAVNWLDKDRVRLDLKEKEKKGGNRDYILQYRLRGNKIHSGLLLFEGKEENFFLAMVQPPKVVKAEVIPPREYVFIIDVSGSMSGFPLGITKDLFTDLADGLRPVDKFNILFFAGGNNVLSEQSLFATPENIAKAKAVMSGQRGGGGTQLLPALKNALAMGGTEDYARSFIIATDGYVTVEREAFDLIRDNLGNANFFAFGIGSSVNRHIIEGMAHVGKGEPFVLTSNGDAKEMAKKFRKYIEAPVLTNIKVRFEGFNAYDVEPASVPDVLADRPLMLCGKWKGSPEGRLVVEGISGDGPFTSAFSVESTRKREGDKSALRYLWARERIRLLDDYAGAGFATEAHKSEVTAIGLKYNLLTRFTSFIAIDSEVRNTSGGVNTVVQPLPLPQGVSNNASGNIVGTTHSMPKSTYAPMHSVTTSVTREEVVKSVNLNVVEDVVYDDSPDLMDVKEYDEEQAEMFTIVEEMPEFIGGMDRLKTFLKNNFRYPPELKISGIHGTVYLQFTVEKDGRISDIKVLRGLHPLIDQAAIDVLKMTSGQWKAGKQRGQAVACQFNLPIRVNP